MSGAGFGLGDMQAASKASPPHFGLRLIEEAA